ncbi:helix-turn-helix domain-containing protein [Agrobacterium pusense]|uniref:helix-turn-helix domain-containing protein n=1 Tax=Agrobacterium pusense TaxID=648995 RepID=UPI000D3CC713|nr:hypothetical protein [Agrobacterium pusense]PTV70172.1 hypothetical protein DBL06_25245 [Agrobacterium pusense]
MAKTMDPAYFVAWRKRIGLTQAQFAAKSGDHLVTVKRWETGARKLPPHIGWIMAAIEHGLEPVGQEAMFEYSGDPRDPRTPEWEQEQVDRRLEAKREHDAKGRAMREAMAEEKKAD